jgi:alpha 1,3-glucosidase
VKNGVAIGTILKDVRGLEAPVELPYIISFLASGTARIEVDEKRRQTGDIEIRHNSPARKERYNEAANWAIVGGLNKGEAEVVSSDKELTVIKYGPDGQFEARIKHNPFVIDFVRDGKTQVTLNSEGLLNVEHWRQKVDKVQEEPKEGEEQAKASGEDESTWWEETFGGNTDSKPRGPESIGLDVTFPGYEHVFGIPGHASPLSLKETR